MQIADAENAAFDLLVMGSGAAGLTAAIVAAAGGLRVLVVEKTRWIGGTTAFSGGVAWIPNNHLMAAAGLSDSHESAERYLRGLLGNHWDGGKVGAYLRAAPAMLAWMEANSEARFMAVPGPDYSPQIAGAAFGRSVLSLGYDGRRLGSILKKLRPSLPQLAAFGTLQIGVVDLAPFRNLHRSPRAFLYATRRFASFLRDRLLQGRGARLENGNALVGRLLRSALDAGVEIWTEASLEGLDRDADGRVVGGQVRRGKSLTKVAATRGVVLASGGFGANREMRARHVPMADAGANLQPDGNVGDGIALAEAAGARIASGNAHAGSWAPVSFRIDRAGRRTVYPHMLLDRHCPGQIMVDGNGNRFVNEGANYQHVVAEMQRLGIATAWLIADRPAQRRYGMGLAKAAPWPLRRYVRSGYLIEAPTIRALAARIGVDGAVLERTISGFNGPAVLGLDPAFDRGADDYSRTSGDPGRLPSSALAPLESAPFYALAIHPGDFCTVTGLVTDERARVLDAADQPIPGLYAAGIDMNSIWAGHYPGGGASIGPAMTFGYIAARECMAKSAAGPAG